MQHLAVANKTHKTCHRIAIPTTLAYLLCMLATTNIVAAPVRTIEIDVSTAGKPLDRFYDLSIGADYPGTLIREDSQAQLRRSSTSSVFATSASTRSSTTFWRRYA